MKENRQTKAQAVLTLQGYLRVIANENGVAAPPADGVYGAQTEQAVKDFQTSAGLEATGNADLATWEALRKASGDCEENAATALGLLCFPPSPDGYELARGDENTTVLILQLILRELSLDFDEPDGAEGSVGGDDPLSPSGVFDGATEQAVLHFQSCHGLGETGRVDKKTWNRLAHAFNVRFGETYTS